MKIEAMAKPRKTRAPRKVIFLMEMNLAMRAPASTAPPVQMAWPRQPPRITPTWAVWWRALNVATDHIVYPGEHDGGQLGAVAPLRDEGQGERVDKQLVVGIKDF